MGFRGSAWREGPSLRILADEPIVASHQDALFVPGNRRGIFDRNGRPVVPATDFDADGIPEGGDWSVDPAEGAEAQAAAVPHVHAGPAPTGLASLLARTLPRFWSRVTTHGGAARLLFHGGEDVLDRAFADAHVLAAFASLGIARADCVSYGERVRIRSLVAPAPAFEPTCGIAHDAHRRTLARLADALAGPDPGEDTTAGPLHLAASTPIDDRFGHALDEALRGAGVRVVDPEGIPLAAIVDAVRRAPVVSAVVSPGGLGPALAAFARPGTPVLLLRPDDSGDAAEARLAAQLLGHRGGLLEGRQPPDGDGGAASALINAIAHAAASRRRGACSTEWSVPGEGAPDAVLGDLLTGRAQMRTGHGQRPWWAVDLGRIRPVVGLRVHGPADGEPDCPDGLRVLASADRRGWTVVAERARGTPVGNGLGDLPAWDVALPSATEARHLRIQLVTTGVLALDQVEIRTK